MTSALPLIFVRRSYSAFGGGELLLQRTMERMQARGRDVSIIAQDWVDVEGVRYIPARPGWTVRTLRARAFSNTVCGIVGAMGPAVVQSNERILCCDILRAGDGVHAAYVARRAAHIGLPGRLMQNVSPFHHEMMKLEREAFASPRLKAVIAISEMVKRDIEQAFDMTGKKLVHIPNGVDLQRFNPSAQDFYRVETRKRLQVSPTRNVVLFAGSGFARKGLAVAIQAIARLKDDSELWVAGSDTRIGGYKLLAQRLGVGKRVRFLGGVKDMLPLYGAVDAVVLPSLYEPFGTAVLEGMACGLSVVVSTDCGAAEAVNRFDPRLIVETGSVDALAVAIERALDQGATAGAKAAARAVAENYGLDAMVDKMLSLYDTTGVE